MINYIESIDHYLRRLFPITRSITGNGNRETLKILQELIPLQIKEYPSGQRVYDWTIPREWNIKDAWIKHSSGQKIVNFNNSNVHVVGYSMPVHQKMSFSELISHLYYLEDMPKAIPYRTTYYHENWGFCLSYEDFLKHFDTDGEYEVFIDSTLTNGSLTTGELIVPGKGKEEILISTYICHPSLANDNLSGMVMTAFLAKELLKRKLSFTCRIIFVPETIGAIAYCANNEEAMKTIDCGFVVCCVGGPAKFGYKQSFNQEHFINRAVEKIFRKNGLDFTTYPFDLNGSDERQYSSQGFRINTGSIVKDKYYEYDYYHTSFDNLDFIKAEYINDSLNLYLQVMEELDRRTVYKNLTPNCEVMLSKHGLYPKIGAAQFPGKKPLSELDIIRWLLFYSDGRTSLQEIADKLDIDIDQLYSAAEKLREKRLLKRV
ncbi:MAG: DUF4910 domain-containing protein [Candidatus Bathyarchaeota archaeon]